MFCVSETAKNWQVPLEKPVGVLQAVSYTHLDVYKRQLLYSPLNRYNDHNYEINERHCTVGKQTFTKVCTTNVSGQKLWREVSNKEFSDDKLKGSHFYNFKDKCEWKGTPESSEIRNYRNV